MHLALVQIIIFVESQYLDMSSWGTLIGFDNVHYWCKVKCEEGQGLHIQTGGSTASEAKPNNTYDRMKLALLATIAVKKLFFHENKKCK